ncbi:unnamed protein product [Linum tenue]|uniref:Uncharacterized protein n=1 Tax=Linum tenue TaxID=586396 RepID=A0AAV0KA22_9ROSI|nr:unnamed protein product [Linum tenue]
MDAFDSYIRRPDPPSKGTSSLPSLTLPLMVLSLNPISLYISLYTLSYILF